MGTARRFSNLVFGLARCIVYLNVAILRFVLVKSILAEAVLATHFGNWHPGFLFLDHPNDLGFGATALWHSFVPSKC